VAEAGATGSIGSWSLRRGVALAALGLLAALAAPLSARALTLDWTLDPWPGTDVRTATYDVDGEDVIITVTDNANVIDAGSGFRDGFAPGSLATNSYQDPPSNAGADNLFIKTYANTLANTGGDYVTVDVFFTHVGGVTDVELSFFDVDLMSFATIFFFSVGFTDEIEMSAGYGASVFDPTSVASIAGSSPTWAFDGTNTVTGTSEAASGSDDGTVVVSFGQVVDRVSFQYRNMLSNGQIQWIGLSNISFRRVPEPSSGLLLAFGLVLIAARRRRPSR
jgi:hypothetical protein